MAKHLPPLRKYAVLAVLDAPKDWKLIGWARLEDVIKPHARVEGRHNNQSCLSTGQIRFEPDENDRGHGHFRCSMTEEVHDEHGWSILAWPDESPFSDGEPW